MWASGSIQKLTAENAAKVAQATGVSVEWLSTGKGAMLEGAGNTSRLEFVARGQVPVISWVQAGMAAEISDPFPTGVSDRWLSTRVPVSDMALALEVRGDSMEPEFPEGAIIVVDPAKEARHGSFVVVRFEHEAEATFKQLKIDGARRYLAPLNDRYPIIPINGEATIVGVVVQADITRTY